MADISSWETMEPRQRRTDQSSLRQILPLALLIYVAVLLPPEVRLEAASVNLPAYRILIIALMPFVLPRFASEHARFGLVDWLLMVMAGWMLVSFIDVYGLSDGIVRGSGLIIDAAGAYLVARASIDGTMALRRLLVIAAPAFLLAGLEMMLESITHTAIVRPIFAQIFGSEQVYEGGVAIGAVDFGALKEIRLGLMRAAGPFSHSILAGVTLAGLVSLWLGSGLRSWPRWAGLASALLGLFSLSSAAFLALALAGAFFSLDRLRRVAPQMTWPFIVPGILMAMLVVQLTSQGGVVQVLARLTLNPQTAAFRLLIWEYGTASVLKHPLFGIGFAQYERLRWMVSSIDAHFLLLAVRHGLLVPVLLVTAIAVTMVRLGTRSAKVSRADRDLMVAVNFTLAIMVISGLTVSFFGGTNIWFMALVGIAASLTTGQAAEAVANRAWPPAPPLPSRPHPAPSPG